MQTILCVFGTRPEAIKLAPVIRELRKHPDRVLCKVCVSAQHREMLDQVLSLFGVVPDYDLNVMEQDQLPAQVLGATLHRLEKILEEERPAWVVVQGDTTTTVAASLAAYYARSRVAHVEAGLRTPHKWSPFPEEIHRRMIGVLADLHLAPTEKARRNLLQEGLSAERIRVTGNPVIDALLWAVAQPFDLRSLPLPRSPWNGDTKLILVTAHRRESFGPPLRRICFALRELAARCNGRVQFVYPVHLNPNVCQPVRALLENVPGITLLPPLDYLPLVHLLKHTFLVLTDSGGIQEEAPSLGVPVLVLRDLTERCEGVEAGTARVVGTDPKRIVAETLRLLEDPAEYRGMAQAVNPYGDGRAAGRIVEAILSC